VIAAAEAVDLAAAIYAPQPRDFDWVGPAGDAYCGIKYYADCDAVALRGSVTDLDWLRDALSETPTAIPGFAALGELPFGFSLGMAAAYAAIEKLLRPGMPLFTIGHSLAADEAIVLGAMRVVSGGALAGVFGFEPPRAGTPVLTRLLATYPVELSCNGADPVPHLPVPTPVWPWEHPRALIRLDVPPPGLAAWDPIAWHRIALVQAGIKGLPA
jgi:hypothetical protein